MVPESIVVATILCGTTIVRDPLRNYLFWDLGPRVPESIVVATILCGTIIVWDPYKLQSRKI